MNFLKRLIDNIVQPLTSMTGLAIIIVAIVLWANGVVDMKWDGALGIAIGVLLLLAPDKVVSLIVKAFNKILKNGSNS